jgi:hypothetical protein
VFERAETFDGLDRAATVIGSCFFSLFKFPDKLQVYQSTALAQNFIHRILSALLHC